VVDLFLEFYSHLVGDLALRTLSYGGIFLIGSISITVAEYIKKNQDKWMKSYIENRPHIAKVFELVPVSVVKEEDCGLQGAFVVTKQMISRKN